MAEIGPVHIPQPIPDVNQLRVGQRPSTPTFFLRAAPPVFRALIVGGNNSNVDLGVMRAAAIPALPIPPSLWASRAPKIPFPAPGLSPTTIAFDLSLGYTAEGRVTNRSSATFPLAMGYDVAASALPPTLGGLYASLLRADRPIAWWGLDSSSPSTDESGHGYDLTVVGAPSSGATLLTHGNEINGASRNFNGSSDAYYTLGTLLDPPSVPPSYHSATAAAGNTADSLITSPQDIEAGDLMLTCLVHSTNTATISSSPAGWTQIGTTLNAGNSAVAVFRRSPSADEPPTEFKWTWSTSGTTLTTMLVYRNCDPDISGLVYDSGQQATSSGAFHSTTTETHPIQSHVLAFWCGEFVGTITPDPTGVKKRVDISTGNVKIVAAEYDVAAAGSVAKTASTNEATQLGVFLLTFGAPNEVREDTLDALSEKIGLHALINPDTVAAGTRTIIRKQNSWGLHLNAGALEFVYRDGGGIDRTIVGPNMSAAVTTHVVLADDGTEIRFYKDGGSPLLWEGSFETGAAIGADASGWAVDVGTAVVDFHATDVVHPSTGGYRCYSNGQTTSVEIISKNYIPVDTSQPYVLSHYVRQWQQLGIVDPNGTIRLVCYDGNKVQLGQVYPNEAAAGVSYDSGHAITYTGSFVRWGGRYRGSSGVAGGNTGGFIAGTRYVRVEVILQYTPSSFSAGIGVICDACQLIQGEAAETFLDAESYRSGGTHLGSGFSPNANRVTIGAYHSGSYGSYFDGRLDEVAVFDAPLSDSMVAAYYEAHTLGTFGQFLQPSGGTPRYPRAKLEVAWASIPTDATLVWTDITGDLRATEAISSKRGRNFELDRVEAGQLNFTVSNRDRKYDPAYASSPLYPNVTPTRAVRLRAQADVDGAVHGIFFGYTEGHPLLYPSYGTDATAHFSAVDPFKALALDQVLGALVRGQELSGARLAALLDGFPGIPFTGESGQSEVVGDDLGGVNSLDHAQQVTETEGGILFADSEGTVTFQDRHHRTKEERAVRAIYGDGAGELPIKGMEPLIDEARLFTAASVTPSSGRVQSVFDVVQAAQHFLRTKILTTLHANDNDATAMAEAFAHRYAVPRTRVPSIDLQPSGRATAPLEMWETVLGHEFSHRIRTVIRPLGDTSAVTREHFIEGVSHAISGDDWIVSLSVSPAELEGDYWLLGTGELGDTSGLTATTLGW